MTHKQTKQICGTWKPIVKNLILNEDNTLSDPGTLHIDSARWVSDHENIRHFDIFFTYTPPESVCVERVEFDLTFPTEFHHIGSLYGWFVCGSGDLIALNPDALFTKARVSVSANVKKGSIRGVFISKKS